MPARDGTAVVRRYIEDVLGGGRLDLLNELVTPGYVDHAAQPGRSPGMAEIREVTYMFRTAFPNLTGGCCIDDEVPVGQDPSACS